MVAVNDNAIFEILTFQLIQKENSTSQFELLEVYHIWYKSQDQSSIKIKLNFNTTNNEKTNFEKKLKPSKKTHSTS